MEVRECILCREPISRREGNGSWIDVQNSRQGARPIPHEHRPVDE